MLKTEKNTYIEHTPQSIHKAMTMLSPSIHPIPPDQRPFHLRVVFFGLRPSYGRAPIGPECLPSVKLLIISSFRFHFVRFTLPATLPQQLLLPLPSKV